MSARSNRRFSKSLNRFSRKRRETARRRSHNKFELGRLLQMQPLEQRYLLASDVIIGSTQTGDFVRAQEGNTAIFRPISDQVEIPAATIVAELDNGLNVRVETAGPGSGEGNIRISSSISKTDNRDVSLTLLATKDIDIFRTLEATSGTLDVWLGSDADNSGSGGIDIHSRISTNGGDITIGGGLNAAENFAIGSDTQSAGVSIEASTLSTAGGDVSIRGRGISSLPHTAAGVEFLRASIETGSGDIEIVGVGSDNNADGNYGVAIRNSDLNANEGDVTVTGTGTGTGVNAHGIFFDDTESGGSMISTTTGDIRLVGTGSASATGESDGLQIGAGSNTISSASGDITLELVAGFDGSGFRSVVDGNQIGDAASKGNVTITSNLLDIGTAILTGTGNLRLQPLDPTTNIGIGSSSANATFELTSGELATFQDGFAKITIGHPDATGAVDIDEAAFTDPVEIIGGSITVNNDLTGDGGMTLTTPRCIRHRSGHQHSDRNCFR